jgi:hypothetical protein
VGSGARWVRERGSRRVGSGSCSFESGPGASGSVALRQRVGSVRDRSGARFGRSRAWGGARFRDAPARSAVRGSGPEGGRFGNPGSRALLLLDELLSMGIRFNANFSRF